MIAIDSEFVSPPIKCTPYSWLIFGEPAGEGSNPFLGDGLGNVMSSM